MEYIENFYSTAYVTLYTVDGLHIFKLLELGCKYLRVCVCVSVCVCVYVCVCVCVS